MSKTIREYSYVFDQPVRYKELFIYPIKIKDYYEFSFYAQSLMLEKNSIKDPQLAIKAISMSYLEYLLQYPEKIKVGNLEYDFYQLFDGLIRLSLNIRESEEKIKYGLIPHPFFEINGIKYGSDDFDEIRSIIAEQNMLDLPDERIQKNVRDSLEEAKRFKQKLNNNKVASFEEQIMALATYTGWELEYIYEVTYRKFILAIRRANQNIMPNIYLTASLSGFVSFKDKSILKSWLADIEIEDKYEDVKMSPEQLQSKANFDEARKK